MPLCTSARCEETVNAVTHGAGFAASLVGLPFLILAAHAREPGGAAAVVGASVFGAAMLLLYGISTVYHAWPETRGKRIWRVLDHAAIYLLIAGTYTPFTLGVLAGPWGWSLFGTVWGLALLGIVLRSLGGLRDCRRCQRLGIALYVAMGWMIVIAAGPMIERMAVAGLVWLALGGVLYTGGLWFFARDHRRWHHAAWHVFVLGGSVCHYFAVLWDAG